MIQKLRENPSLQGLLLVSPTLLWLLILLIIPLVLTIITSFGGRSPDGNVIYGFSLSNYLRIFGLGGEKFDPFYLGVIIASLWLSLQTTILVILLAYPIAYFVARSPINRRSLYLFLILVPLWTNFVLRIYAWIMILRTQGVFNSVLGWLAGLVSLPFTPFDLYPSDTAVLIGMVYEFLPFMILPIYTSLEKIENSWYEAAADLGANPVRTFFRITLPLSMPGMTAGIVLVFIPVMGTFIVSDILGGRQTVLIGNLIQRQFLEARDPAFGSALSIFLMILTLVITLYYTRRFGLGEEIVKA